MNTPEPVSPRDMLDIIFANRNRTYGAYPIRRAYPQTMRRALGWGMLLIGFFLGLPHFIAALSAALPSEKDESTIYEPGRAPIIEVPPPPPPIIETPPPPVRATIAYTPPRVIREDEPQEDRPQTAPDEILISEAEVGKTTQAGDPDAPPVIEEKVVSDVYVENSSVVKEEIYDNFSVQKPPTFPGGEKELLKFLAENIKYPSLARENNIQGNVALTFVVDKNGQVSDITVLRDIGGGCGKEALRVMNAMPKWSPGEANGHAVKVRFTLPVRFRLE